MFAQQSSALYRCIDHRASDDSYNEKGELYCTEGDSCSLRSQPNDVNTLDYIFRYQSVSSNNCDVKAFRLDLCHNQTNNLKRNDLIRCGKNCTFQCIETLMGNVKVNCNDADDRNIMEGNWSIIHFTSFSNSYIALIDTDSKCTIIMQVHGYK